MFSSYSTVRLGDSGMHRGAASDAMHVNQPSQLSPTHTYVKPLHTPTHAYEIYKPMCARTHTLTQAHSYTGTHSYIG